MILLINKFGKICTKSVLLILTLISGFAYLTYFITRINENAFPADVNYYRVVDFHEVFKNLDSDNDGMLTFNEFSAIKHSYELSFNSESSHRNEIQFFPDLPIKPVDQVVNIKTYFTPLDLSSLSKELRSGLHEPMVSLKGLLTWTKPYKDQHNFSANAFSVFLPPPDIPCSPGTTWWVVGSNHDQLLMPPSTSKLYPNLVEERLRPLFALLSLFHPRPFLWTRFAPQGTIAILRAMGKDFLDIVFRIHAEFQLNEAPLLPFWFTPAQFFGRLIISKNGSIVHHFELEVPAGRKLNVDMEWFNGPSEENMEVDIGYIPQMHLTSNKSTTAKDVFAHLASIENAMPGENIEEISLESALHSLSLSFYPFKKVEYYNFTDAFELAASQSKLVHGILLWGSLDDQSC